ncbi:ABC transporter substrate-binding protein [Labedella endophytica]|uniref:Sugar ABC transporter substrate-binding protein n=1 Tax=Labedella endophytica TaxID=1523160 RepID=A0A433JP32_9MICO|nr:sugar ABC transporter substrate-binding protein [Labedella endophytica]RUQ98193.1 sugar ABC transporter substrate-binding protein [Labedella endophytica]
MRRPTTITAGVIAAALALTGCAGSADSSGSSGDGSGAVSFVGPEDPAVFAPVIDAFEAAYPDITVDYTQVPFDTYATTLQQRLSAKDDTIDVFAVDQPNLAQIAAQGFLEDLSDLEDEAKAATSAAQFDINIYDGTMYALPVWNSTQMLFYNKDILDAAGIEAPSLNPDERWTWEQVAEAGAQAQAAGIESGLLLEQAEAYYQLQPLIESLGGGSGITGDDMLTADVTTDGWVEAMEWYGGTFESGLSPRGVGGFQTSAVFTDQKTAFFVGGPWDIGGFADADFAWGIAPHPSFDGGEAVTPTGSWSWGVNTASTNKDAARTFLEFVALDAAGNLASTETQTIIPANTEAAAEYLPKLEALGGDNSAGAADLITYEIENTAVARPVSIGYVQFESIINAAIADIRNGSDAMERLTQAQQQIEDAWSQLR